MESGIGSADGNVGLGASLGTGQARSGSGAPGASRALRDPSFLRACLLGLARDEGFDLVGIAAVEPSAHGDFLDRWLDASHHGTMHYLARPDAVERRKDPERSLPGARSALVVGHAYDQPDPPGVPEDPARGVVARYARGRDYHKIVPGKLRRVLRGLEAALGAEAGSGSGSTTDSGAGTRVSGGFNARICVDTAPVLERELALRAGFGWFGRNTMLIHPRRGSYFFIGALLLDLDVEPDERFERDHCGTCRACLDACPTGALLGKDEDGAPIMDARRCISYLTIENRGPIPVELRPKIGNRIYGCDICQEVCPFNARFSEMSSEPGYAARGPGEAPVGVEDVSDDVSAETRAPLHPGTDGPALVDLLEMALSEDAWDAFSRGSAIRRAGRAGFARNVCVGLGNWGAPEAVPVLVSALSDPDPLVRTHAAWALGRVGSPEAREALVARSSVESNDSVRSEITAAVSS